MSGMVLSNLELCPSKIKHRELTGHADEIVDLYLNYNLTLRELGLRFKTDKGAIKRILSRGGTNDLQNLTIACRSCNARKGIKTFSEFQKEVILW